MDQVDDELIEILADIEHERWSSWMRHMFNNFTVDNLMRWFGQMHTHYSNLSDYEQESDRQEVYKTLEAIRKYYDSKK